MYSPWVQKKFQLGAYRGHRTPERKFATPKTSETTRARMLKLKTQLDIVKYSLWVKNFSAKGRPGGVGPPSVNVGTSKISGK